MMKTFTLWMTLILSGGGWEISWSPAPDNIILEVTTTCGEGFSATSRYTITPDDFHALVHRIPPPPGLSCQVTAEIRTGTDGDYEGERTGQSASTRDGS